MIRVVAFIDYQNVYSRARGLFHDPFKESSAGQVNPLKLADLITLKGLADRELQEVRVYRGQPDSSKEPKTYGANRRQCNAWRLLPKVTVITRPLRYPARWPEARAEEKGIDVALAIDFVKMAVRREYDVGIIMSTDTDLKPALEAVIELGGDPYPRCEVAAWSHEEQNTGRLSVPQRKSWCHWLDESDYRQVADPTDYTEGS